MADEAESKPAAPAPAKSGAQVAAETVVDVLAIAGVVLLAALGKVDGGLAVLVSALLAGVRVTDLLNAQGGGKSGGGSGLAAAVVGIGGVLGHAVAALLRGGGGGHA